MKSWNRIGKIKALIILVNCIFVLATLKATKNDLDLTIGDYIFVGFTFFFITLVFLTLGIKFRSLFKIQYNKPSWNKNPFNNGLTSLQFFGYWFFIIGLVQTIAQIIIFVQVKGTYIIMGFIGMAFLMTIKLSILWLKLGNTKN